MACTGVPHLFCVLLFGLVFAGTVTLHVLSWYHTDTTEDLFDYERQDLWELHHVSYLPTEWLSYIWAAVYFLQIPWLLYALTFVCMRKDIAQIMRDIIPCGVYFLLLLACGGIAAWLFLWDRKPEWTEYAILCLLGTSIFTFLALGVSVGRLRKNHQELRLNASTDLWAARVLVQNGIAALAAWSTVVVFHGVSVLMLEETSLELDTIQYIFMGIVFFYVIIWFAMSILGSQFTIVVITPYLVTLATYVAIAIEGDKTRGNTGDDVRFITCCVLGAITLVLLLIELSVSCGMEKRLNAFERKASLKAMSNGGPKYSM